jgi:hypothetical protein
MIAAITIDYLLELGHGVAYVYCNYKAQEEQDASSMLAAILKQLVQGRLSSIEPIERLHQRHTTGAPAHHLTRSAPRSERCLHITLPFI